MPQKNLVLPILLVVCSLTLLANMSQSLTASKSLSTDAVALVAPCNCSNKEILSQYSTGSDQPLSVNEASPLDTSIARNDKSGNLPVSILFALVGDHPGFMAEFEVSLKSILLNFPFHSPAMNIYIMLDDAAHKAVLPLLTGNETKTHSTSLLNQSAWPLPISIHLYPVESYHQEWVKQVIQTVGRINTQTHTIGTYYRLFADRVLPPEVGPILYLDTDVVILASLDDLWKHVNTTQMYQWAGSKGRIAGFMILNLYLFRQWNFWKMVEDLNKDFTINDADQGILKVVQDKNPQCCGWIPERAWGLHKELIWGHMKHKSNLDYFVSVEPRAGMFHLNGGGGSKKSYFLDLPKEHFQVVQYYVNLRWPWVRYFGESRTGPRGGFPLEIVDHAQAKPA